MKKVTTKRAVTTSARTARSTAGRRLEGARCDYVLGTGTPCTRRASASGKCTLHNRRLADTGTRFYVVFTPLPGYQAEPVRRGPFRPARAVEIMTDPNIMKEAQARGFAMQQVRAS